MIIPISEAIYLMGKAYVVFLALYRMIQTCAYFVTMAKSKLEYSVKEQNFNFDESTGIRADKTIVLTGDISQRNFIHRCCDW